MFLHPSSRSAPALASTPTPRSPGFSPKISRWRGRAPYRDSNSNTIDLTMLYTTQALDGLHKIAQLAADFPSRCERTQFHRWFFWDRRGFSSDPSIIRLPIEQVNESRISIVVLLRWVEDLVRLPRDNPVPVSAQRFYLRWTDVGSRATRLKRAGWIRRFLKSDIDEKILASLVEEVNTSIHEFLSIVLAEEDITDHAQARTTAFDLGHAGVSTLRAARQPASCDELSQVTETPSSSIEAYVNPPTQEPSIGGPNQERNTSFPSSLSEAGRYTNTPAGSSLDDYSHSSHDTPSTTDENKAPHLRWFDVISIVVTSLGIWKFVATHLGQSFVPNMLDLVVGTIWAIICTVLSANSESTASALLFLFKKGPRDVVRPLFVRAWGIRNAQNMDASSDSYSLSDVERGMRTAVGTP